MKNNIYIMQVLKSFKKNQLKILFSVALIFTLIVAIPISTINVYAALKEDCDLDGFDDATGVAVPWPGYDETKGDTPSGPGGGSITSTKASTSTTATTAATTAPTTAAVTAATTAPTTAAIVTETTAASTNNASKVTTNNTSSEAASSAVNSGSEDTNEQSTVVNSDTVASTTVQSKDESVAPVSVDAIINTKGSLNIIDAKGSIIHIGSSIIISGTGFIGNSDGLDIEIHSEPLKLSTVKSSKDGSFQVQIDIPENLEAGTHNIVVSYQGKEIISQQIEVAPKAADTFWGALTVGFSADNKGLVPGLLIIAGLIIVGGATLLIGRIINVRRKKDIS